jgi:asparagine N-glycosylation enzyme membrane subunit Stt3
MKEEGQALVEYSMIATISLTVTVVGLLLGIAIVRRMVMTNEPQYSCPTMSMPIPTSQAQ